MSTDVCAHLTPQLSRKGAIIRVELTRFRGRLTRSKFGAEVAYEIKQESGTTGAAHVQR
jgi:predicted secreted Zn-dependent protease